MKNWVLNIIRTVNTHHTGAYAAQAAYFFVLSLIPIFLLLITMVQYTPVTMNDVMELVLPVSADPQRDRAGLYKIEWIHPVYFTGCPVVGRKRRSVCDLWIELHL